MSFITHLNVTDFIIMGVILLSLLISLARGFVREALSLATWIIAAYIAFRYSGVVSDMLTGIVSSHSARSVIAIIGLFMVMLILGGIVNYFISSMISGSLLLGFDRILGSFFGLARGLLVVGLFILLIGQTAMVKAQWWKDSQMIPQFTPVSQFIKDIFPEQIAQLSISEKPETTKVKTKTIKIKREK
ncbi:MAG: CvpA family protein [Pseudomonadota bacterium]|nr:CvpA family protein [Pseudomonadota bacterium]